MSQFYCPESLKFSDKSSAESLKYAFYSLHAIRLELVVLIIVAGFVPWKNIFSVGKQILFLADS